MANLTLEDIKKAKHIHFIGIGGVSMSTLAAVAAKRGHIVSGSDRTETKITKRLSEMGVNVSYTHCAKNVQGADLVVFTWAIPEDNPELLAAREAGIPLMARCDFLGELMRAYPCCVGVSGTHGKSTTTGMLSHIFISAGADPTVACGAELSELGGAYTLGDGDHFIYESCEYRDSFLSFHPDIAVILNVDHDHVDYFPTIDDVIASFEKSLRGAKSVVYNRDDKNACRAVENFKGKKIGIALEARDASYRAENLSSHDGKWSFDLICGGEKLCSVTLGAPGKHNVYNALCALAVSIEAGIDAGCAAEALSTFTGADRRMQYRGDFMGARVYDDYAHHPEELAATISCALSMEHSRVFCVFQPHTYTRAREFASEFARELSRVDTAILADVYAAREKSDGTTSAIISDKIKGGLYISGNDAIKAYLCANAKAGDIILCVGAGDIYKLADALCV